MNVDSPFLLLSAALLLAIAIAVWPLAAPLRPGARVNLRFAAMLLAAIAIAAPLPRIGDVAVLVALPPAAAALALAALASFTRHAPAFAGIAPVLSVIAGLGAVILAAPMLAAIAVALAAFVIIVVALQDLAWIGALSGALLLAALFAFLARGADVALLLFAAAALLGLLRSAFAVQQPRPSRFEGAIGRMR